MSKGQGKGLADWVSYDISFCSYKGDCPKRKDCRRCLTEAECKALAGRLVSMCGFEGMREDNFACFLPRNGK